MPAKVFYVTLKHLSKLTVFYGKMTKILRDCLCLEVDIRWFSNNTA